MQAEVNYLLTLCKASFGPIILFYRCTIQGHTLVMLKLDWLKSKVLNEYTDLQGPQIKQKNHSPVVQSIISLMSSLVVKILTVLVSIISSSEVFLLKKCE